MDRERMKELLPVMRAYAEGATLQCRGKPSGRFDPPWNDLRPHEEPGWLKGLEYRVKPKEPRKFTVAVNKNTGDILSHQYSRGYANWEVIEVVEVIKE